MIRRLTEDVPLGSLDTKMTDYSFALQTNPS